MYDKRVDYATWLMAWPRFALCAAALDLMPYDVSMIHMEAVMEVAATAQLDGGRTSWLAVLFDEESR